MSLPTPKLDDKDFDTLRKEAIRRIPELCPTWTDFNPSDPGITIIELMAWMTEMMLYRLNRVPEKNYIKFLELMGVKLAPPRPARSWVVFELAKGAREETLPVIEAGTRVSTKPGGGKPVVFETTDSLNLTAANIKMLCSRVGDWNTDHPLALLKDGKGQEEIFCGCTRVSRSLYLRARQFKDLPDNSRIEVSVKVEEQSETTIREIEWEAWDGIAWAPLSPVIGPSGLTSSGDIVLKTDFKLEPCIVDDEKAVWLRARLLSAEGDEFPMLSSLQAAVSLDPASAKQPEAVFQRTNTAGDHQMLQPLDLNAGFEPFGRVPEPGNELYIFSPLFGRKGAECQVHFVGLRKHRAADSKQVVSWEYWSAEERWLSLGREPELDDGTDVLTDDGTVTFVVPEDVAQPSILGHSGYAIRACLKSSDASYTKGSQPTFSAIRIAFTEPASDFDAYVREVCGVFEKIELAPGTGFHPFLTLANEGQTLCLALDSCPAKRIQRIYFQLAEDYVELPPSVVWEYWTKHEDEAQAKWCKLEVRNDTTRGLSMSGMLDFLTPDAWQPGTPEQEVEGYWMRARRVVADLPRASVLNGLYLNATEVMEGTSSRERVLGSSNGEPFQIFSIEAGERQILPGISLLVRELERPGGDEVRDLETRLSTELKEEKDEAGTLSAVYSLWHEVENFFKSAPDDCHYTLDQQRGAITFGDGRNGRIPPTGRNNIVAERYYMGGGAHGNVGQNTIAVLEVAKDFVKGVRNVEPAQGGRDVETIEAAKLRGPWALRHRRRAVTREDFECLAKEATTEVALTKCFPPDDTGTEGETVLVVIVPTSDEIGARPRPSSRLIQTVRSYLDERRLLTTKLQVVGPSYDDLDIEVVPVLKSGFTGSFSDIQREIEEELKRIFDPLKGGPEGTGWPMGRTVHISELYYQLEQVEGVDHVGCLCMSEQLKGDKKCKDQEGCKEKIKIGTRSFPYCRQINVTGEEDLNDG